MKVFGGSVPASSGQPSPGALGGFLRSSFPFILGPFITEAEIDHNFFSLLFTFGTFFHISQI